MTPSNDVQSYFVTDIEKHTHHTDTTLRNAVTFLEEQHANWQAKRITKGTFDLLEKSTGLNYIANGLLCCSLLCRVFKPISTLMYDWMHIYIVNLCLLSSTIVVELWRSMTIHKYTLCVN